MEPKEYREGWTEFCGTKINLTKRPLIPRPETEYWTDKVIKSIGNSSVTVLDMFTGSGCIGIAIAAHCPNARVTLSDKTNYVSTSLPKNCKFVESDLFLNLETKFDYIVANPPYIPEGKGAKPDKNGESIMDYEPPEALYAGTDGLSIIRPFLKDVPNHLSGEGQLWMELGTGQKGAVTDFLRAYGYYDHFSCAFQRDQYGVTRFVVARL